MGEGESFAELLQRVAAVKEKLKRQPHGFIAVFNHGLFLRALWILLMTAVFISPVLTHPTCLVMVGIKSYNFVI